MIATRGAAAIAASLIVAGCTSPAPPPTAFPGLVTQPYFEPILVSWAVAFREETGAALPFDLETETSAEGLHRIESGEAAVLVTSGGTPADWFATPLGAQAVGVIVHPDNPVRELSLEELRGLLSGRIPSWQSVGGRAIPVQPVVPLPGEPMRGYLDNILLDGLRPWPGSYLAPTPSAAITLVAEQPGAFGFVPLAAMAEQVRLIRVNGVLPAETTVASGDYPLTLDLLATAIEEPESPLRDFLIWIQSRTP